MKKFITHIHALLLLSVIHPVAGEIVVSTFDELIDAVNNGNPGDTILLTDGTYNIENTWSIPVSKDNMLIKSQSGDREKVIINGRGMTADDHHGFWVDAKDVIICDMTIQNVRNHCIQTDIDTDGLHVKNCILKNAGEQMLKVPKGDSDSPSENGIVENCLFEYSAGIGPQYYIGGIDCHFSKDWIVRSNVFKYIRSPEDQIAEHAIHFWSNSEGTLVEKNLIIDCDRGIGFGLGDRGHTGGIIRNNMIYHRNISGTDNGDVGIVLETSPKTQVYNNTILFEHDYINAIEYRFSATIEVYIVNNLTNKKIASRDGASGTVTNNVTNAVSDWFTDVSTGDLHLSSAGISDVIDQGIPIAGLTDDFDGESRPQDPAVDIGADEYGLVNINFPGNKDAFHKMFHLYHNHLSPSHPLIRISFFSPVEGNVLISIYDMQGRSVKTLFNGIKPAGTHHITWNTTYQSGGTYLCKIEMAEKNIYEAKKIILLK